ncbi:unnamed protein product, partial [Mesorhabditis belari]|uniref:Uncharacterized protein n=1 Tax=Mesorhabditis belari TaxID=2138241 RepID=A0AAF3FIQ0_9BILA
MIAGLIVKHSRYTENLSFSATSSLRNIDAILRVLPSCHFKEFLTRVEAFDAMLNWIRWSEFPGKYSKAILHFASYYTYRYAFNHITRLFPLNSKVQRNCISKMIPTVVREMEEKAAEWNEFSRRYDVYKENGCCFLIIDRQNDENPCVEQYLDSNLYSIFILAGYSPSIGVMMATLERGTFNKKI